MFELFQRSPLRDGVEAFDVELVLERLAEALVDAGLDPDGRTFAAMFKMLSDDVAWYCDRVVAPTIEAMPTAGE